MKLMGGKKNQQPTRREVAARRQAESGMDAGPQTSSYVRGRTLSSRKSAAEEPSERQASWDLRKRRKRLVRYLVSVLAVAVVIMFILTQLVIEVTVESAGHELGEDPRGKYENSLNQYFAERPIERLRFMIDESALRSFFLHNSPEVQSVQVAPGSRMTRGTLNLSFRKPVAQWSSGGKVHFVDDTGTIFEKNYFDTPAIVVKDQSGVGTYAGQEAANRRFLSFLGRVVHLFGENGLSVVEAAIPPDAVRQVEFRLDGKSYSVKMTVDRSAESQVDESMHAVRYMEGQGRHPEYIDVRVDQRVFYK